MHHRYSTERRWRVRMISAIATDRHPSTVHCTTTPLLRYVQHTASGRSSSGPPLQPAADQAYWIQEQPRAGCAPIRGCCSPLYWSFPSMRRHSPFSRHLASRPIAPPVMELLDQAQDTAATRRDPVDGQPRSTTMVWTSHHSTLTRSKVLPLVRRGGCLAGWR